MTVTPASFRTNFPEFTDAVAYPDAQVSFYLSIAALSMDTTRWGGLLDFGTQLMVAHQLVIDRRAQLEAQSGGIPGTNTGPISSKSVDKVSVGFDTGAASEEGAGHWNLTVYGTRYWRLVLMIGAGPIQVGLPDANTLPALSSLFAWGMPWFVSPNPSG